MLAIGRALMAAPRLLLLDEPSLGLAPQMVRRIAEVIREINEQGTAVLLVEQNSRHGALPREPRARTRSGETRLSGPAGNSPAPTPYAASTWASWRRTRAA